MTKIEEHLGSTEQIEYKFRPSRKAFLWEYVLFVFVMILTFTSLYPLIMSQFRSIAIIGTIAKIVFYILFTFSIFLLIRVEYKIGSKSYALTNHRVMISQGIFTEKFTSVAYDKITDVGLEQTFWNKILNVGKISLDTAGGDEIEEVLRNVSKPLEVKKKISDLQMANRSGAASSVRNPIHHMHGQNIQRK